MTRHVSRRDVLRGIGLAGIVAIGAPLAGCSSPSDGGNGGDGGDGGDTTPTPTATSTPASGGDGEWVETDSVDMTDELTFEPKRIQVAAGTTVTWVNVGTIGHTVTAYEEEIPADAAFFASGDFDSEEAARDGYPAEGNIPEGESYEHTFETTGDFEYFCIPHELSGMVGTVRVV